MVLNILERLRADPKSILKPNYRYQLWATLTIQIFVLSHGIALGWTSPTVHKLQSPDSPTNFVITVEQTSWIGSLYGLGGLLGNILYGLIINRIGRKWCLRVMALPQLCSWILKFYANNYFLLYVARFLVGVSAGANFVAASIFICEIADCHIRGALCAMNVLSMSFGILFGYILTSHLNYYIVPCIVIMLPILYTILITGFPESPQFLLRRQKIDEARRSFHLYKRLPPPATTVEAAGQITENAEFQQLQKDIEESFGSTDKLEVKDFFNSASLLGFSTVVMLVLLSQFSGSLALISYTSDVFAYSGSNLNPNTCTIWIGVIQIFGGSCSTFLVDRFGRRFMMLGSTTGYAICLVVFASYIKFAEEAIKLQFNWLPLVIMMIAIFFGSCGVIGLVFTVMVEVIPVKIRGIGTAMAMGFMSIMSFVALKLWPVLLHTYGLDNLLYCCCGVCIVCWIYLFIFQKETNGVSMNK